MQPTPTMARANGHAKQFDVLKLGDTVEERRPVELNGRQLYAWVTTNGRYPASVAAELDDARNRWLASRAPINPSLAIPSTLWDAAETLADVLEQTSDPVEIITAARAVGELVRGLQEEPEMKSTEVEWQRYLTRALCTLIPGVEEHEAELLDMSTRLRVVTALGYLRLPQASEEEDDDEQAAEGGDDSGGEPQSPPEKGPSSIGDEPEPVSAVSTA